jgi:heme-degrading monooxygenase HmoA
MKGIAVAAALCGAFLITGCAVTRSARATQETPVIVHTVFFRLNHAKSSAAEREFFAKAGALARIEGVDNFRILRETSPKNPFDYGLSMEFENQQAYDRYNAHPVHAGFVANVWLKEVAEFQEIDYVEFDSIQSAR